MGDYNPATLSTLRDWMGGADRPILNPDAHEAIFGGGSGVWSQLDEIVGGIDWDALAVDDDDADIDPVGDVDLGSLIDDDDAEDFAATGGADGAGVTIITCTITHNGETHTVTEEVPDQGAADGGIDEFIEKVNGGDDLDTFVVRVPVQVAAPEDNIMPPSSPFN